MAELVLEWMEAGASRSQRIQPNQPSKSPGTVRLGRDAQRCDIVFTDSSVSGLQAEILYNAANQSFYLRSLRDSNPPLLNGQPITGTEVPLGSASTISLGRLVLNAKTIVSPGAVPPTEVNSLGNNVPPTVVAPQPQYGAIPSPPAYSPPAPPPPGFSTPSPAPAYPAYSGTEPQGPKIWVWLIAGALLIGGGAYAWPYVSDFLGISKEASVSPASDKDKSSTSKQDQSPSTQQDRPQDKDDDSTGGMADLSTYTHSSGLFELRVPKDWQREDKSKAGTVALLWSAEDGESAITVNLTTSNNNIDHQAFDRRTREFLQDTYGQEPDFSLGKSTRLDNDGVRVDWSFTSKDGKLLGATYSEQLESKVSIMQLLVLESNLDKVDQTLADIRTSYQIDPSVDIP
ncbi:MAG: FHA domain-containing protein [Acaryochloridaceae cyanobacterium SU_2_1]|nr:FHA domain-containing protein [Acaryochloridaceae cyanobacterium SU_2_1]